MATTANLGIEKLTGASYVDYESFNTAYEILDKLGVAYITAKGTSSEWYYRQWSDGRYDLWLAKSLSNQSMTQKWGNFYYCNIASIKFPVTFASKPHMTVTFSTTSGNTAFAVPNTGLSTTGTGTIMLCNGESGKTATGILSIHVSGTIKS